MIRAKNVKKWLTAAAAAALAGFSVLFSVNAHAADGASSTGASLPAYSTAEEANVIDFDADPEGKKDSAKALQEALDIAKENASDSHQVVVRVPAGTYKISKPLSIYSNTQLILEDGATILKGFSQGCMLRNTQQYEGGGYAGDRNIVIEGGTWDGNISQYNDVYAFSNIRIAHASNIVFRNVTVLNNKNGHHLEIGGVQGLTISGCYFSGYTGSLLKEAIQLDVMNCEELFAGYAPFDDTACDNVIIESCTFKDLPRAIGSHSAVVGEYYTNVTIRNNTFEDITNICMILYNYRKCTVTSNTIKNCGAGITFNYMSDEDFRHYFRSSHGNDMAAEKINDNADTIIENNTISTKATTLQFSPFGIKLYGRSVEENKDYPAYNYIIKNVRISGNTVTSEGSCLIMQNVRESSVRDNDFKGGEIESDLVTASYCSDVTLKNNSFSDSLKCGLRVENSSAVNASQNAFSGTDSYAAVFNSSSDCSLSSGTIKDCGSGAVKISSAGGTTTVSKNIIKDFGKYGVQLLNSAEGTQCEIKSNDFANGENGIHCSENGRAFLSGNSFEAVSDKVYADTQELITLGEAKNFTAEEVTADRIKLTWNAIGEADGVYVYRRSAGTEQFELIATAASGSIYQDERLVSGTNYYYKIVPYITIGEEDTKNTESAEILARTKINISASYVECISEAAFTAKPVTPEFSVTAASRKLNAGTDYEYSYENNIYPGVATIRIIGKGDYVGTLNYSFNISVGGKRISAASSRTAIASAPFAKLGSCKFSVNCTLTGGMLLADSDKRLTLGERYINSITSKVGISTAVKGRLWSGGEYEGFGSRFS